MGDAAVGIIGMGDMGKMYARRISDAGWRYASTAVETTEHQVHPYQKVRSHATHFGSLPSACNDDLSAFGSSMAVWHQPFRNGAVDQAAVTDVKSQLPYFNLSEKHAASTYTYYLSNFAIRG